MIDVQNLSISYGDEKALENVSFQVERNETLAIIGPSGCGKTTLLYALAGIQKHESGMIVINSKKLNGIRKNTGFILQDYGLLPWKTVWDNIAFPLKSRHYTKQQVKDKVLEVLMSLNLVEYSQKYPGELSGGQKQRVAIGRTLALEPDLLLMDEASSALDAITKEHLQNMILKIYQEKKMTLVLVTHNIEEAVFLGQKIMVMSKGKTKKVITNPYFGASNLRSNLDFYKICLEVRKSLDDE